jgi:hypothetical protein
MGVLFRQRAKGRAGWRVGREAGVNDSATAQHPQGRKGLAGVPARKPRASGIRRIRLGPLGPTHRDIRPDWGRGGSRDAVLWVLVLGWG